jgi:DNA primase
VIKLPHNEDPASFFSGNKGDFQSLISGAEDIFQFLLSSIGHNFLSKPLSQKIQTTRSFLNVITNIGDSLKKDILLQKAAKAFDIPFESLKQELERIQGKTSIPEQSSQIIVKDDAEPVSLLEKRIFCAIMNNIQLFSGESRLQLIKYLPSPLRDILAQLKETNENTETVTFGYFFDTLNERNKQYVSKLLLEEDEIVDNAAFDKLLEQLQKKQWKMIVQHIKAQLAQAKQQGNTEKVALILQDFMELQNKLL